MEFIEQFRSNLKLLEPLGQPLAYPDAKEVEPRSHLLTTPVITTRGVIFSEQDPEQHHLEVRA